MSWTKNPFTDQLDNVGSGISSVVAGTGISIDSSDPLNPIVSLYTTPSYTSMTNGAGVQEKGITVVTVLLSWTKNKTLTSQSIDQGVGDIGANDLSYNYTTSFNTNKTFTITGSDGTTTATKTTTVSFVYPYYYGVGAAGLSGAQIAALTKSIIASTATLTETFSPTAQVMYFAYPAAYADLTSILDPNGFETIADWTKSTKAIVGLDTTSQNYTCYEFKNVVTVSGYNYTFKR